MKSNLNQVMSKIDDDIVEQGVSVQNKEQMKKIKYSKKKRSIIGGAALGFVAAGLALVCLINLAPEADDNDGLTGTMLENVQEGTGEYDWKKYEVNIPLGTKENKNNRTTYKTNHDDDNIHEIFFNYVASGNGKGKASYLYPNMKIAYYQDFSWSDDLETFFVLQDGDNRYITAVETSHTDIDPDNIILRYATWKKNGLGDNTYIVEIWVRTVD